MPGVTVPLLFGGAVAAVLGAVIWRKHMAQARDQFLAQYDFSRLLDKRLAARRPELDASQRRAVFDGLRDWFQINHAAGRRKLAMPSQAVDDAWHEFILFTRNYQAFCRHGLGRFLHHVPAEAMSSPTQAQTGLKRSWRLACGHEGIDPKAPTHLPRLFAIDAALGLADGFRYQLDCMKAGAAGTGAYCAGHIGCGGGCSGCGSDSGGDGGCGGGCGGD
ncbi:MAG: hypothetical protein DWQ11_00105 [Proteobacteria bacterium]|nr:MAG: hypothetical protein DWQ11_00105 [Pseudomonadota bacterium]